MVHRKFQVGDRVVYRKTKHSSHPGPRAEQIVPSQGGDDYAYCVDKYWVVKENADGQKIVVQTRRGKVHTLKRDDPNLRHAYFWERWFLRSRFPVPDTQVRTSVGSTSPADSAGDA